MRFPRAMSPCCLDEPRSSTPSRHMELTGAPIGKDLLGGLGEHLCEEHEHLLRALGHAPWAWRRTGLAWRGTKVPRGMAAAAAHRSARARSAPERCALEAIACHAWLDQRPSAGGGRRADRSKGADRNEYVDDDVIFYLETEERGVLGWHRASHQRCIRPPRRPLPEAKVFF
jgi:hypothetical protein